jgi:hypothetical protein
MSIFAARFRSPRPILIQVGRYLQQLNSPVLQAQQEPRLLLLPQLFSPLQHRHPPPCPNHRIPPSLAHFLQNRRQTRRPVPPRLSMVEQRFLVSFLSATHLLLQPGLRGAPSAFCLRVLIRLPLNLQRTSAECCNNSRCCCCSL